MGRKYFGSKDHAMEQKGNAMLMLALLVGLAATFAWWWLPPAEGSCASWFGCSNGPDVYTWANGQKYDGYWKDGKRHGRGVHTWASGQKYDGEWKDGKEHGRGVFTWPDGSKQDAEWKDGTKLPPTPRPTPRPTPQPTLARCADPGVPDHGTREPPEGPFRAGDAVRFQCREGFAIGGGTQRRKCDPNGEWNGVQPSCTATNSGEPSAPSQDGPSLKLVLRSHKLSQFEAKMRGLGVESAVDLLEMEQSDLAEMGFKKLHLKRFGVLLDELRAESSGQQHLLAAGIEVALDTAGAHMDADECEAAYQLLLVTRRKADELSKAQDDLLGRVEWKLLQASSCLGYFMLPQPQKGEVCQDTSCCGIPHLADEQLMKDFNRASASTRAAQKLKHWDKWFSMFGTSRAACSVRVVKRGRRKLSLEFHPDKLKHPEWCAKTMSLLVNAGFEMLSQHASCGGAFRDSGHGELRLR